jgi:hypothetical protein
LRNCTTFLDTIKLIAELYDVVSEAICNEAIYVEGYVGDELPTNQIDNLVV